MRHQLAIAAQRLTNMKSGINQAMAYLTGVEAELVGDKPNIKVITTEVSELRELLLWIASQ